MFKITYTDKFTKERKTYLNIGFETLEAAQAELKRINLEREKLKGMGAYLNRKNVGRAVYSGYNFRIKKFEPRKLP